MIYAYSINTGEVYLTDRQEFVAPEQARADGYTPVLLYSDISDPDNMIVADSTYLRRHLAAMGLPVPEALMTAQDKAAQRLAEIDSRLAAIDAAISRPAGAIADILSLAAEEGQNGVPRAHTLEELYQLDLERAWLAEYRAEAAELRAERAACVASSTS